jgi:hypothetical protein
MQPYKPKLAILISFVCNEDDEILVRTRSPVILSDKTLINNYINGD